MSPDLTKIKHIVVVMMENRSFDHALGYRSLEKYRKVGVDVDGLQDAPAWNAKIASTYDGSSYLP